MAEIRFKCCTHCGSAEDVSADQARCPGCGKSYTSPGIVRVPATVPPKTSRRGFIAMIAAVAVGGPLVKVAAPAKASGFIEACAAQHEAIQCVTTYGPVSYGNGFSVPMKALNLDDLTAAMAIMRQVAERQRQHEEEFVRKLFEPVPPHLIDNTIWKL